MTFDEFVASLGGAKPPAGLTAPLQALWLDGKGLWKEAHDVVDDMDGRVAASVHAYLHRKEGDLSNAGYWYGQAGRRPASGTLQTEWDALVRELV